MNLSRQQLEEIWTIIKQESEILANCEPILANFFHATLLKHDNFGNALSYILANKLATQIMLAIVVREIIQDAYQNDKQIIYYAARALKAIEQLDPAVDKYSIPLLYLKGFHAVQAYRVGDWLWKLDRATLATDLQSQISVSFGVEIHPAASIG